MNDTMVHRRRSLFFLVPALLAALLLALVMAGSSRAAVTINVNSTADGTGGCAGTGGQCTLRAAIQKANTSPGADTINLPAGTYSLTRPPINEGAIANGDLDVTDDLTINGAGKAATIIDGGDPPPGSPPEITGLDRLFEIHPSVGSVQFSRVTLQDGYAVEYGGAIFNAGDASVLVSDSNLSRNHSGNTGGAIENHAGGAVRVTANTRITGNDAGGSGGGIHNEGLGSVTVEETTLLNNSTLDSGGAISNGAELGIGRVTLNGATFTNNRAANGGAVANEGRLTVRNSTFGNNRATAEGGGIHNSGTLLATLNNAFTGNTALDWGGGISNSGLGRATVRDATFTENSALDGGGLASSGDGIQVTVEDSDFVGNKAHGYGGGLHNANDKGVFELTGGAFTGNEAVNGGGFSNEGHSTATVSGTRFSENKARIKDGNGGEGGGLMIESGAVRITGAEVLGNFATVGGGGVAYHGDAAVAIGESAAIEDTTIDGNTTAGTGGGVIHQGDGVIKVARSILTNNQADAGGGFYTDGDGEATLENTTVTGNKASTFGGGVLVSSTAHIVHATIMNNSATRGGGVNNGGSDRFGDGFVYLRNSIVANSRSGGNCAGVITTEGGNLDSDNTCDLRAVHGDHAGVVPRLTPLQNNGGPTLTHALRATSPAVDGGTDQLPLDALPSETDQRGVLRPQGDGYDIGAYESVPDTQTCPTAPVSVSATADSSISQASPDDNSGNDSKLEVRSKTGQNARSLIRFALPAAGTGCQIVNAKLQLYSASEQPGRTLQALRVTESWGEYGVTWNNQPTTTIPAAKVTSRMGMLNWTVTNQIKAMYTASSNNGFLIRDAAENDPTTSPEQSFHSREKAPDRPPELIITFGGPIQ